MNEMVTRNEVTRAIAQATATLALMVGTIAALMAPVVSSL